MSTGQLPFFTFLNINAFKIYTQVSNRIYMFNSLLSGMSGKRCFSDGKSVNSKSTNYRETTHIYFVKKKLLWLWCELRYGCCSSAIETCDTIVRLWL